MTTPPSSTVQKIFLPIALLAITIVFALYLFTPSNKESADKTEIMPQSVSRSELVIEQFLEQHWHHPIAPQGSPPPHYSAIEASLDPQNCAACHQTQFAHWKNSLHSQTMTAGILWQFDLLPPAEISSCLNCHAPLAEQRALIAKELNWSNAPKSPVPDYVPDTLAHQGLVCASCHVRNHQRFGPEPQKEIDESTLAHGGFTVSDAFSNSRFCSSCHQFPESGPRTNGKLREDTFNQWQASAFAQSENPTHCQSCHMPNREHHWKGIHDEGMVRSALATELIRDRDQLTLLLKNVGAGHDFPTYMVPKIEVQIVVDDGNKETMISRETIGWHVDINLTQEYFDQRLKSGEERRYLAKLPSNIASDANIKIYLDVAPREHYERTFEFVLAQRDKLQPKTLSLLEQAYQEVKATRYRLLLAQQPLNLIEHEKTP
ncbi:MAG: hypothetical protein ACI4NJ_03455 [Cellvibrio sp.]